MPKNEICKFALEQYKDYLYDFFDKGNSSTDNFLKEELIKMNKMESSIESFNQDIKNINEFIKSSERVRRDLIINYLNNIEILINKNFTYKVFKMFDNNDLKLMIMMGDCICTIGVYLNQPYVGFKLNSAENRDIIVNIKKEIERSEETNDPNYDLWYYTDTLDPYLELKRLLNKIENLR